MIKRLLSYSVNLIIINTLIMFLCGNALAGDDIVKNMCIASLEKKVKIPFPERDRYCSCLSMQATPKLSGHQIGLMKEMMTEIEKNDFPTQMLQLIEKSEISNIMSVGAD